MSKQHHLGDRASERAKVIRPEGKGRAGSLDKYRGVCYRFSCFEKAFIGKKQRTAMLCISKKCLTFSDHVKLLHLVRKVNPRIDVTCIEHFSNLSFYISNYYLKLY